MNILREHAQSCSVCLHKSPKDILCSFIYVGTSGVLGEILFQRDLITRMSRKVRMIDATYFWQLALEHIDLVEE